MCWHFVPIETQGIHGLKHIIYEIDVLNIVDGANNYELFTEIKSKLLFN